MMQANHKKNTAPLSAFITETLKPFHWHIAGMMFVAIIWAIDMSLRPYLVKIILDRLNNTPPQAVFHALAWPISIFVLLSLFFVFLFRFYDFVALKLKPRLKQQIIEKLVGYLMGHSHEFYQNNFAGALSTKLYDVATGMRELVSIVFERFLSLTLGITIAIYTLYQIDIRFAITLFVWVIVFVGIVFLNIRRAHALSDKASDVNSAMIGKIVDAVTNITSVRLFAGQAYEEKHLHHWTEKEVRCEQKLDWFFIKLWFFQGFSMVIMEAVCVWFLMTGRESGNITIGDFALIFAITIHIFDSMWNLSKDVTQFTEHLGKVTQGLRLTTQTHDIQDIPSAPVLHVTHGEIRFDKVHFHYSDVAPLFSNKSIIIHPGQKIGLVGYSGSGKSTFVSLILRIFEIQSGKILIDGQDISKVTQNSLRQAISMIPQDPVLFHRSLAENIQYGRLTATHEEIIEASQKAHAHDFIQDIPKQYNALVGERGIKLSGGQRQRIAIARAILKNAPILILDEATSALDSVTEAVIQDSLMTLMQGKTTLIVAHRLSTLLHMDRILVFHQGKIVEDGTHEHLLAKNGRYKKLWDAQVGGFLPEQ